MKLVAVEQNGVPTMPDCSISERGVRLYGRITHNNVPVFVPAYNTFFPTVYIKKYKQSFLYVYSF